MFSYKNFSVIETGKRANLTVYHWSENECNLLELWKNKQILPKGLFVCDDPEEWNINCHYALKMEIEIFNPLFIINDSKSLEEYFCDHWVFHNDEDEASENKFIQDLMDKGYDSFGNIPKTNIIGTRQLLLMHPNKQILHMERYV